MIFNIYKLGELGELARGKSKHRPRYDPVLYGGNYPFIQTGDIKAANKYITSYETTYNEVGLSQSKLWKSGILCITIAANIAETALLSIDACFPDSVVAFDANPKVTSNEYMYYYFQNFKKQIQNNANGSVQENINLKILNNLEVRVPDIKVQNKIVSMLSLIDSKIELNNQMIATLEELAATLFKRWFIDFEFPDENGNPYKSSGGKMVDSELGEIPEGWGVTALRNTFKHKKEVFNPRKYQNRDVLHFSMPSFDKNQMPISDNSDDIKSNKNIIGKYTVLFSKMNPEIKRVWLPNYKDGILNVTSTEFIVVDTNNKEEQSFLYSLLSSMSFQNYLLNNVTGSTGSRQRIKPNIAMQYSFAYNENYSKLLAKILCPLTSQIMDFRLENQSLNNLRDSLLPKFLSDELEL